MMYKIRIELSFLNSCLFGVLHVCQISMLYCIIMCIPSPVLKLRTIYNGNGGIFYLPSLTLKLKFFGSTYRLFYLF